MMGNRSIRRRRMRRTVSRPRCRFTPRGHSSPTRETLRTLDYKNLELLSKFITNQGKIFSRKRSGNSAKAQHALGIAIKQARFMALLPYVAE